MQVGCPVEIKMIKMMLEGEKINPQGYFAEILEYKPLSERIYLVLREGSLEDISLDAVYECSVEEEREPKLCYGVIVEQSVLSKLGCPFPIRELISQSFLVRLAQREYRIEYSCNAETPRVIGDIELGI